VKPSDFLFYGDLLEHRSLIVDIFVERLNMIKFNGEVYYGNFAFNFELPNEFIAGYPAENRDESK